MTMIPSPDTVPMPVLTAPPTRESPLEIATRRAIAWSESLHDEAAVNLPDDVVAVLEAGLPAAIAKAREDLEPVEPEEVVMALQAWADRRNLPLPEGLSLDLDVETMSAWPRVVFREAFRRAWERFSYPRVPTAAELHRYVAEDVKQARGRLASLDTAARKLETIRMLRRWDEEARSRHAAIKARERAGQRQPAAIDPLSVGETPCSAEASPTETSQDTGNPLHQPTSAQDLEQAGLEQAAAVVSPTDSTDSVEQSDQAVPSDLVPSDLGAACRESYRWTGSRDLAECVTIRPASSSNGGKGPTGPREQWDREAHANKGDENGPGESRETRRGGASIRAIHGMRASSGGRLPSARRRRLPRSRRPPDAIVSEQETTGARSLPPPRRASA
jgi:hypothetical protein